MKIGRKGLAYILSALIVASASYGAGFTGVGAAAAQALTQTRCEVGAFMQHSDQAGNVEDTTGSDSVSVDSGDVTSAAAQLKTKAIGVNLIPNPGLESGATTPDAWNTTTFGNNQAVFTTVAGHNSPRAVRVDISGYKDGAADWYYQPVGVHSGSYYLFTDYYRSDVSTRVNVMFQDNAGRSYYSELQNMPASSHWTKYQVSFFVPEGYTKATVFHPLAANGTLITDDYYLAPAQPKGFNRPIVSLTFDDGWGSIHDRGLAILKHNGVVSTQYLISGYLGQDKAYMSVKDVYDFQNSGSEVGSHTVDHPDLTTLDAGQVNFELTRSQADLGKCFGTPVDFAAPYGTYNSATIAQEQKYYETARSTDDGFNTADNLNPYHLLVQDMSNDTTQAQLQSWVDIAKANHQLNVLVLNVIGNPLRLRRENLGIHG